jgi:hypothetical protein
MGITRMRSLPWADSNLGYAPLKGLHMCKELARNQMKWKMFFFQLENKFGIT